MAKAKNKEQIKWLDSAIIRLQNKEVTADDLIESIRIAVDVPDGTSVFTKKEAFTTIQILERVATSPTKFLQALYNMRLRAEGMYNI